MELSNAGVSLKRNKNFSEEFGSFKIIQTDPHTDVQSLNHSKKKTISQYKILQNETRQSNRHKTPSGVWKYFAFAKKSTSTDKDSIEDPDDRILCLLCYGKGRVHVYKSKTSSSNLWKHVNRKHNIEIPSEKIFAVCTSSFDGFDFVVGDGDGEDGNISADYPLSALDVDDDNVLVKAEFEVINECQRDDIQSNLEIEDDDQDVNVNNIFKYDVCTTNEEVHKDIGLAIIEEVSKRPILYEVQSSKLSSTRATREMMWVEVYEALGEVIQIDRIQKIWKNIRDRYKKIRNNTRDGLECSPKYKYYDYLSFLDDGDHFRNHVSDISFNEPAEKKSRTEDYSFLIEQTDGILSTVDDLVQIDQNYSTEAFAETSNCTVSSSNPPPPMTATIYPLEVDTKHFESTPAKQTAPPSTPSQAPTVVSDNNTDQMDEFDLFGKFIANKLRNAPKDRINLIEVKIMQAIFENI